MFYREEKLSGCDKFQQSSLFLDIYRQPFRLLLPDGHDTYRTLIGAVLSFLSIVVLLAYGSFKFTKLMDQENFKVQMRDLENQYPSSAVFTATDGFMVAAGLA